MHLAVGTFGAIVADELVVGVFQFQLADARIEALNEADTGLGEGGDGHQGGALGDLAAAFEFFLAGVIGDLADRDARAGHAAATHLAGHAAQRRGVRRFVADHRRIADRRCVSAAGAGHGADAAGEGQRTKGHGDAAQGGTGVGRGFNQDRACH